MDATPSPLLSEARVTTATPRRYLGQLCKHFQHKLPVTLDGRHGSIQFQAGVCDAEATEDDSTLVLRVAAADAEALARLEDVVARHLLRFAFREEMEVRWQRR